MTLKVKTLIKIVIYKILELFIKPTNAIKSKSILLIRLDGIGDYILFRNFIEVLKKSNKYKGYSITLLGNIAWKDLSKELDSEYIDNFIWLERSRFYNNLFYRYKKLKEIVSNGYEIILSPIYSREPFIADNIVKLISAEEKIGSIGNLSNIKKWQKDITDKYYTKLIYAKKELMFEFYRNKEFFEYLLDTQINITKPIISFKDKKLDLELPKKYAILFVGGSENLKRWNTENFTKVGNYLKKQYGYNIVLCGAKEDIRQANEIERHFDKKIINLVGRTNLLELVKIIHNGELIFSNETSAPHFAVALKMKYIFVIFSGKYYGWFCPYPNEITKNYHIIHHPNINKNWYDHKKLSKSYGFLKNQNINEIRFERVKNELDLVLNNLQI
jgi:ADP-heptose:LPS heptosyltransferase